MKSKFTQMAQSTLASALSFAREFGHSYIGSEHLLLGLLSADDSSAARFLSAGGVDTERLREVICRIAGTSPAVTLLPSDMTPKTKKIIERSSLIAQKYGQHYIGTEHLLLSLLDERDCVAVRILESLGIRTADIKRELGEFLEGIGDVVPVVREEDTAEPHGIFKNAPTLLKYGRDLTAAAESGRIDPIIGRDGETERVMRILCRRSKNNPCLIGEPGVGKTAVVEGLAQMIADGNIPDLLADKRIVTLDIPSMIAGAKYRGEFEERLKAVMEEARKNSEIVLFIDEIHTIVGAGAAEGAVDAANILKPALARGEIQLIGATTLKEYRRNIEKDAALERRFQPVTVSEPAREDAVAILCGLRDKYEAHHGIKISDGAIKAAVELSARYINDRFLPDKAIDLIDETASGKKIAAHIAPTELRELEARLCDVIHEKEEAISNQHFERAAKLRDDEQRLRKEISELKDKLGTERTDARSEEISAADVAATLTRLTGVPVKDITDDESRRLGKLNSKLSERVIGQKRACDAVCSTILRGRTGLGRQNGPIGSFIFLGRSGVGKTELCRVLSELLFGSQKFLIRFDMSEYMEKHSVSRLIGSPPGYVGYGEGGQLTEAVRRTPYSLLLFDEIEKAHPDIFNLLLQILEDGMLTDSEGRHVDFKNTVIIMTSNIGSQYTRSRRLGFSADAKDDIAETQERVMRSLREAFRPEFLDRIDECIYFPPLSEEDVESICRRQLSELASRADESGITLEYDESLIKLICRDDNSPGGARHLRRRIARLCERPLSEMMVSGELSRGDTARLSVGKSDDSALIEIIRKN